MKVSGAETFPMKTHHRDHVNPNFSNHTLCIRFTCSVILTFFCSSVNSLAIADALIALNNS